MKSAKPALAVLIIVFFASVVVPAQYEARKENASPKNSFVWPEGKRAAISLSFDDARPSQVDAGVPLLNRYGVHATFYLSPSNLGERVEAWKKAGAAGHEMGNHALTHPCSGNFEWSRDRALENYSLDKMRAELVGANEAIQRQLGQ